MFACFATDSWTLACYVKSELEGLLCVYWADLHWSQWETSTYDSWSYQNTNLLLSLTLNLMFMCFIFSCTSKRKEQKVCWCCLIHTVQTWSINVLDQTHWSSVVFPCRGASTNRAEAAPPLQHFTVGLVKNIPKNKVSDSAGRTRGRLSFHLFSSSEFKL